MFGLFRRAAQPHAPDTGVLGTSVLALRLSAGDAVPAGCIGVTFDRSGATQRVTNGARVPSGDAFAFQPGPYEVRFAPFAASPEIGLHLTFVIDRPDPRVAQQRFDLYLASEAGERLALADFGGLVQETLQRELAQGSLELPPCTIPDEWDAFRGGLNRVLYQRFGITVEDCIPVDMEEVDYARMLRERGPVQVRPVAATTRPVPPSAVDALALRRLFLELPALASALRLVVLPEGRGYFPKQQELLQRLDHVALQVDTMPALGFAGPGAALTAEGQAQRAEASSEAVRALDEAWSLVARLAAAPEALLDEADRIVANLELHCAARRATP